MRRTSLSLTALAAVATSALLGGCGGGGSGSASGSGSGSGSTQTVSPPATNSATISVDGGPANIANIPFVSITICVPGSTAQCQTIDHVEVDTGSSGVRILSSVLSASLSLPQATASSGSALVECTQFADGYSWGPVKSVDLQVGGEKAAAIPVQIIGDPAYATVPSDCSSSGTQEDSVSAFGANGIIGVGPFIEDCGGACAARAISGTYYSCASATTCQPSAATAAQQVVNPVARFPSDNNGVIIELPTVGATGSASPTGSLVFGIDTESNNSLGTAKVYTLDASSGTFSTTYKSVTYSNSYIDSGSNANYFVDSAIPVCPSSSQSAPGFFCPTTTQSLSATIAGHNAVTTTVPFSVANGETLIRDNPSSRAYSNLAGPPSDKSSFDWGLPFFFGRHVYTAIENANTSGGIGPYFGF